MLTIIAIVLVLWLLGGGWGWRSGYYGPGIYGGGLVTLLIILALLLFFFPHPARHF